jgi:hypothetical protein
VSSCDAMGAVGPLLRLVPSSRRLLAQISTPLIRIARLLFVRIQAYPSAVVDKTARLAHRRHRHYTLPCGECGKRIAWTTPVQLLFFGSGNVDNAWFWQGRRVPIQMRQEIDGQVVVDAQCFRCGWKTTYPNVPTLVENLVR